jgi:hypothetical protein
MNIKNIAIVKPVKMYNKDDDSFYFNKQGLMLVEYEDNTRRYLDIVNRVDITDYEEWEPILDKKSKMNYIFEGDKEYYI